MVVCADVGLDGLVWRAPLLVGAPFGGGRIGFDAKERTPLIELSRFPHEASLLLQPRPIQM